MPKYIPYNRSTAHRLLDAVATNYFSPRAACGEVGIAYGDLLHWLELDPDGFGYQLEIALAKRVHCLEKTYLEAENANIQRIVFPLLQVANPEAFDVSRGLPSPVKQKPTISAPFVRDWVEEPAGSAAEPAISAPSIPGEAGKLKIIRNRDKA